MSEERKRVLYVDDEEALRFLVPLALEPLGYVVKPLEGAREAMDELRAHPDAFDAVVTDLWMPGMSGIDLARQVLVLRPGLPVIVSSGSVRPGERDAAIAAGARDMVLKPDTVQEFARVLDEAIRSELGPR